MILPLTRLLVACLGSVLLVGALSTPAQAAQAKRSMTLNVSPVTAQVGQTVTFTGYLSKSPTGTYLRLERYSGGTWTLVKGTRTLTAAGRYSTTITATSTGAQQYRTKVNAGRTVTAANSRTVTVSTYRKATATLTGTPAQVEPGETFTIVGSVSPYRTGGAVTLERLDGSRWVKAASSAVAPGGGFTFARKPDRDASYRAVVAQTSTYLAATTSPTVRVNVASAPWSRLTTERVSVPVVRPTQANGRSYAPTIATNADGRTGDSTYYSTRASFLTSATNLTYHDANGMVDRYTSSGEVRHPGPAPRPAAFHRMTSRDADGAVVDSSASPGGDALSTNATNVVARAPRLRPGQRRPVVAYSLKEPLPMSVTPDGFAPNGDSFGAVVGTSGGAFASDATDLVDDDQNGRTDVFAWGRDSSERFKVAGITTRGDGRSWAPAVSSDGRFVAFASEATNLTEVADTNGVADIFVWDRQTGQIRRVTDGNGASADPVVTGDGSVIAFTSSATNLVDDTTDSNNRDDVFMWSAATGGIERISNRPDGRAGDGASSSPDITDDGRHLAFASTATDLVPGGTAVGDVFLHDTRTEEITRISRSADGRLANGVSAEPAISDDGRLVLFRSAATNLTPGDTNGVDDIFVWERNAETAITMASKPLPDSELNGASRAPTLSDDGRTVAFASNSKVLTQVPDVSRDDGLVYLRNRDAGTTTAVARGSSPRLDGLGRILAFSSPADDLVSGDTNGLIDVFTWGRATGDFARVVGHDGAQASGRSLGDVDSVLLSGLSRDGNALSVTTSANVFSGRGSAQTSYLADRISGRVTTRLATECDGRATSAFTEGVSDDGGRVVIWSVSMSFTTETRCERGSVWIWTRGAAYLTRVPPPEPHGSLDGDVVALENAALSGNGRWVDFSYYGERWRWDSTTGAARRIPDEVRGGSMSSDGRFVAFSSSKRLATSDTNDHSDVYVWDADQNRFFHISRGSGGAQSDGDSGSPTISRDGRHVAYVSLARNLTVDPDRDDKADVYVADWLD